MAVLVLLQNKAGRGNGEGYGVPKDKGDRENIAGDTFFVRHRNARSGFDRGNPLWDDDIRDGFGGSCGQLCDRGNL